MYSFLTVEHRSNKNVEKNTLLYLFIYYLTAAMLPAINTTVSNVAISFIWFYLHLLCDYFMYRIGKGTLELYSTFLVILPLHLDFKSVLNRLGNSFFKVSIVEKL